MDKPRLLIAVTYRHDMNGDLLAQCIARVGAMLGNGRNRNIFDMDVAIRRHVPQPAPVNAGKFWQQAVAREELIFDYLQDEHDYILWVDADIVVIPPELPSLLYTANPEGVTAPMVFIEGTNQFYDTLGFIEDGARISHTPPYFTAVPDKWGLVDLDSVGCLYLAPADVVRQESYGSPRYDPLHDHPSIESTGHTDHWPVMCAAKDDYRIACLTSVAVYHANLPNYIGEGWH